MGLPSKSRKGKKAWRKNIDDAEEVAAIQKESHQERRGPAMETLQDHELFFEDKGAAAPGPSATRRARAKREPRPTRAQLILSAPQSIKPVVVHSHPARKESVMPLPRQQQQRALQQAGGQLVPAVQQKRKQAADPAAELDLWSGDEGRGDDSEGPSTSHKVLGPVGPTSRAGRHRSKGLPVPRIKAVEVDMAGCSYNPDHESHQDALAVLVATENRKLLRRELAPKAVPLHVPAPQGGPLSELDMLLTDGDPADDAEIPIDEEEEQDADESATANHRQKAKKTKKDKNRAARVTAEVKAAEAKRALKRQRTELQNLPALAAQVEEEERLQALRQARKQVVQEEKAASQPPRLGKLKYEELAVQVLTSDEVGMGLRRLKPYPMLATERFKSLQKRGLIEPRRPAGAQRVGRKVEYEKGARREKATEGQMELDSLKTVNRAKARALKS